MKLRTQHFARRLTLALAVVSGLRAGEEPKRFDYAAKIDVKESFDSNLFMTDVEPNRTLYPNAEDPFVESFITTVTPTVGLDYTPCESFNLSASYAPGMEFYHARSSESHVKHRGNLTFKGKIADAQWELPSNFLFIQGSQESPIYDTSAQVGGPPAIGAIPVRNRRRAFVFLNNFKVTQPIGKWFLRPVVYSYVHDFLTHQRFAGVLFPDGTPNPYAGYENYEDRWEINGGLDVGYEFVKNTRLVVGYRYGHQDQGKIELSPLPTVVNSPYDNDYQRVLFGIEGAPLKWLRLNFLLGPDFRDFGALNNPAYNTDEIVYYANGSISFLPTDRDTIAFRFKRYMQPAFGGPSMYEDITYDVTYGRRFGDKLSLHAGFLAYAGDWQGPVNREDWIYTPSIRLSYAFTDHLSAEGRYAYDWSVSVVPDKPGREFTRHVGTVGLKYAF